jgi:hypothetical protein
MPPLQDRNAAGYDGKYSSTKLGYIWIHTVEHEHAYTVWQQANDETETHKIQL